MEKALKEIVKEKMNEMNMNVLQLAEATGIPSDRIYKWFNEKKSASPKGADELILKKWIESLQSAMEQVPTKIEPDSIYGSLKDMIQVITNLSYQGIKNVDSIAVMAATNQRNTEIIAAMFVEMFPNSKLASQLTALHADQHTDDDLSAESFLGEQDGAPKQKGKDAESNKG